MTEQLHNMNGWRTVPLGEVLKPVSRPEAVEPLSEYRLLGARWYALGLYVKDTLPGSAIRATRVYRVEEGDFVYNRLFAWKGSFAVASRDEHGCYVSNEFPCFHVRQDRLDGRFLWRYLSRASAWTEALGLSSGGTPTSRNRLKEEKLLGMTIPLPPLAEQRRIVAKIDQLAARIEEARGLRERAAIELAVLRRSFYVKAEREARRHGTPRLLSKVVKSHDSGWSPQCEEFPAIGDQWGVLKTTCVQWEGFAPAANKALRPGMTPRCEIVVNDGDVLVTRAGPVNRVGVACAVHDPPAKLMLSDKIVRLVPNADVDPDFLVLMLGTPAAQEYFRHGKTGLAASQVNISREKLLRLELPIPPVPEQRRIVEYLDNLQAKVEALKTLQAQTAAELDALLPSILDKAFKGEL